MDIKELLSAAISRDASDLHLISSSVPVLRISGLLHPLVTFPVISDEEIEKMLFTLVTPEQKELLLANKELDFSVVLNKDGGENFRFRGNAYYQKNSIAVSFRLIPSVVKTLEELNLPPILHEFSKLRQGFVLFTGPSGQGKSTTLASILEEINSNRACHIITIEDPVEYVFTKKKSIVSQREMYQDTHSWKNALKNVLREDPDVVFIGEIRDYETVSAALTIAETGHLVFSTLHTNSAAQTIDRILDIFPANSQGQVKMQFSMVISGIVTQKLVPKVTGGRVPVCEILLGSSSVKNTIREGKVHQIDNVIQTSKDIGMMLFEDHLRELVDQNIIAHDTALEYALRPDRYLETLHG